MSNVVPHLVHLSTMLRSVGETLDIPELVSIGSEILELGTEPEDRILEMMNSENIRVAGVPQPFKKNYDYGSLWPKVMDDYREGKIKTIVDFVKKKRQVERDGKKRKKKASYVAPIDSYCNSKSNVAYWQQLLSSNPSPAVKDFIDYVKEVSCGVGEKK